jgi:hypothetical protein
MAFVDTDPKNNWKFANVSHPVGPGKPNLRDDVTLVQLCLIMFASVNPKKTSVDVSTQPIPLGVFYDDDTGTLIKDSLTCFLSRSCVFLVAFGWRGRVFFLPGDS